MSDDTLTGIPAAGLIDRTTLYIGGAWVAPRGEGVIEVVDPATEQVLATVPAGDAKDVDTAVAAARAALPGWSRTTPAKRRFYLDRLHRALLGRAEEIATTISAETGTPLEAARAVQAALPAAVVSSYADLLTGSASRDTADGSFAIKEPVGVVAAITSGGDPLHRIATTVGGALAAGATVVLKPSGSAPLSAYILAEILHGIGLPAGAFNLVPGTGPVAGEALVSHPGVVMVSFTGSSRVGRRIAEAAATFTRRSLDVDGRSVVVLPGAGLPDTVRRTVAEAMAGGGRARTAPTRLLVPADRCDEAVELARAAAEEYTVGAPDDPATWVGPLSSLARRDRVRACLEQAVAEGARLVTGGPEAPDHLPVGAYVRPTVLADVTEGMAVAREEIPGPVLLVMAYRDEEEALRIADTAGRGASAAVFAGTRAEAVEFARRMDVGTVVINGGSAYPHTPSAGTRQPGSGGEPEVRSLDDFQWTRSLRF
ncbi:aldehyde dehydrogenase family protein [Streptomyces sp. NPDC001922]|uniref:aldehyde dehydrogenase family protein n=1 Tax=Streptomyces sp. NPDC001922 TaxID=3364624 RepID=UPI0036A052AE